MLYNKLQCIPSEHNRKSIKTELWVLLYVLCKSGTKLFDALMLFFEMLFLRKKTDNKKKACTQHAKSFLYSLISKLT